ncbi:MAG: MotA/TolQ/ExbB proton channel family protein [Pseudobdellovibrionaceae bacterium]
MTEVLNFFRDAGIVGWVIMLTGVFSAYLIFDRTKVLYFVYSMNIEAFMQKITSLIASQKVDDAIVLCAQNESKPFAKAFKTILEKADREDEALYQAQDISLSEAIPMFTKKLHYLSMLANVATLLGLLGTIHGLILSFSAVAQADPAQKQQLLAHGISVSMYTTALGLAVAIPVMIAYSFLTSRQNYLIEQMNEKSTRLVEILTGIHASSGDPRVVFPTNLGTSVIAQAEAQKPPSSTKVS